MRHDIDEQNLEGFTLIETALTLGIAGLILSLVFIVMPRVMANARDAQRRDDVLLTTSKLKSFQANNNRGALPSGLTNLGVVDINGAEIKDEDFGPTTGVEWRDFYLSFFNKDYRDPGGDRYNWKVVNCDTPATGVVSAGAACPNADAIMDSTFAGNNFTMYFVVGATCNGNTAVKTPNNRMVSILYRLEQADVYCANT